MRDGKIIEVSLVAIPTLARCRWESDHQSGPAQRQCVLVEGHAGPHIYDEWPHAPKMESRVNLPIDPGEFQLGSLDALLFRCAERGFTPEAICMHPETWELYKLAVRAAYVTCSQDDYLSPAVIQQFRGVLVCSDSSMPKDIISAIGNAGPPKKQTSSPAIPILDLSGKRKITL